MIYHAQRNFQSTMQWRKYYNGHCKVIKTGYFSMFCVFIMHPAQRSKARLGGVHFIS